MPFIDEMNSGGWYLIFKSNTDLFSYFRYIMSPCDQPAIIHSGTRANALHIAANAGKTRMAEVILELVTDPMLVKRMYPNDSPECQAKRQEYLLDLYLNMPKKG